MKIGIFFGCTTRSTPVLFDRLKELMDRAGVEYSSHGLDLCCGAPLLLAGKIEEAKVQAEKVRRSLEGVDVVVTPCPHCYTIIKHEYKEITGKDNGFEVLHITQFLKKLIDEGKIKFKSGFRKRVVYHDPCYIGRESDGIYDEPRDVLKSIPGLELVPLPLEKEDATCCGGGGFVRAYLPRLSAEVAKEKIELQVLPTGAEVLTSACPFCYLNLNDGSEGKIEVEDLVSVVLKGME